MTRNKKKEWLQAAATGTAMALIYAAFVALVFVDAEPKKASDPVNVSYEKESTFGVPYELETATFEHYEVVTVRTTAYCPCERCCGWSTGITCSGTKATAGRTVGANLSEYPIGTILVIDGIEYVVEDTGNLAKGTIDIFFNSHEEALQYGVQYKYALVKGE